MKKIKLGDKVQCKITGFKGIAVGITNWIHGCRRITVQGVKLHEGKPDEPVTFDEPQLDVLGSAKKKKARKSTGGPLPVKIRRF